MIPPTFFLGIDPDSHCTPVAVVSEHGELLGVQMFRTPKTKTYEQAVIAMAEVLAVAPYYGSVLRGMGIYPETAVCAVENQNIAYTAKAGKSPASIVQLAQISGMFLLACGGCCKSYYPDPSEWKGSVPKHIKQARILTSFSMEYETVEPSKKKDGYCVPLPRGRYSAMIEQFTDQHGRAAWKHVVDSMGIAKWVLTQWQRDHAAEAILKAMQPQDRKHGKMILTTP